MPTRFLSGDLFAESGFDAIAHGCNCAGAMGKGIAVEFKRRFPAMYAEYKRRCAAGEFQLGEVFHWEDEGVRVFNLGTQKTWRSKATFEAVTTALERMVEMAEELGVARVGLPRVGAGLGGLPWPEVRALMSEVGARTSVELIVFEHYVPAESAGAR